MSPQEFVDRRAAGPDPSAPEPPVRVPRWPGRLLLWSTVVVGVVAALVVAVTVSHQHSRRAGAEASFLGSPLVTSLGLARDDALDLGYQACARLTPETRRLSGEDDPVTFAAKLWLCGR